MSNPNEVSMKEEIMQAVARGWCSKENEHKEMDVVLAEAIADEVIKIHHEQHIMELSAIMTASIQNTESSIKERISKGHIYWTVAYGDVCRAIDREIELIAKNQSLELENKELKTKCKNLDSIIGSLDVKDPNACDALLNVQLINQNTIKALKEENKRLRTALEKIAGIQVGDFVEGYKDTCKWLVGIAKQVLGGKE